MQVGDFLVNFNRRKIGQVVNIIEDNGITYVIEIKAFGGETISLLPEEVGNYCDRMLPLLREGDIINGHTINYIILKSGEWKAIIKENVLEYTENDIKFVMTKEMCSMFSFWKN